MASKRQAYPSDLTDAHWEIIKAIVPAPKSGGRPAKYSRREVLNALLYVERTGCQWRSLPHDLPPWKLVYWYFMDWRATGLLDHIYDRVRTVVPRATGRRRPPRRLPLHTEHQLVPSLRPATRSPACTRGYDTRQGM